MYIELSKNTIVTTNNVHGFEIIKSITRPVVNPKTKKEKIKKVTERWYYPRLDQCLQKAIEIESSISVDLTDLILTLRKLNNSIDKLSNVFAQKGKVVIIKEENESN